MEVMGPQRRPGRDFCNGWQREGKGKSVREGHGERQTETVRINSKPTVAGTKNHKERKRQEEKRQEETRGQLFGRMLTLSAKS